MKKRIWNLFFISLRLPVWIMAMSGFLLLVPLLWGIRPYAVLSGSMEPAISTGGIVFVNTRADTLGTGDVITYHLGQMNVTHRVKEVLPDGRYETMGDANDFPDAEYVSRDQILGKVLLSIPYMGYIIMYFKTSKGLCVLIWISFLYVCMEILTEKQKKERRAGMESCGKQK